LAIWRSQYNERIGGGETIEGQISLGRRFSLLRTLDLMGKGRVYIYPVWAIKKNSKNHFLPLTRKFSKILDRQRLLILKNFKNLKLKIL
jgi:hypothetical protein